MTTTAPALPVWRPRTQRLGQLAFVEALVVLLGSMLAAVLIGAATAPLADLGTPGGNEFTLDVNSPDAAERTAAIAGLLHIILGTVLGVAALVAGILAIASRRGQGYGVAAVIIALLAPGLSLAAFIASLSVGLAQQL